MWVDSLWPYSEALPQDDKQFFSRTERNADKTKQKICLRSFPSARKNKNLLCLLTILAVYYLGVN